MRVADICSRPALHVTPDASVLSVAKLMRTQHVGALVVMEPKEDGDQPVGMITDRDITVAVAAAGVSTEAITAGDIMTARIATCEEDANLFEAILIMRQRGVRRLPVINSQHALVGMLTADDIYGALGSHLRELSHVMTRERLQEMEVRR